MAQSGSTSPQDDPFAMHLLGSTPRDRLADARAFNLAHTREVVRFNQLTHGIYAPPGGGQFDPEDIIAWQTAHQHDDPECPVPVDGKLGPETMRAVEKRAAPCPRKGQAPAPGPVQPVPYPPVPQVIYPPVPSVPYPPAPQPQPQPQPQLNYLIPGWFVGTALELALHQAEEDERRWTFIVRTAFCGRVTRTDFADRVAINLTANRDEQTQLLARMAVSQAFLQQVAENPWPATLGAMQILKDRARERADSMRTLLALSPGPLVPAEAVVVLDETGEELRTDLTGVGPFLDGAIARTTLDVQSAYVQRRIL